MSTDGATPGNGSQPPFGNGDGNVSGGSKGSNDFLTNPTGGGSKSGGRDFTKESREQKGGSPGCNPDSIPQGGKDPFSQTDPSGADMTTPGTGRKPFKGI